jgi:hypothetical protein
VPPDQPGGVTIGVRVGYSQGGEIGPGGGGKVGLDDFIRSANFKKMVLPCMVIVSGAVLVKKNWRYEGIGRHHVVIAKLSGEGQRRTFRELGGLEPGNYRWVAWLIREPIIRARFPP